MALKLGDGQHQQHQLPGPPLWGGHGPPGGAGHPQKPQGGILGNLAENSLLSHGLGHNPRVGHLEHRTSISGQSG